MKRASTLAGLGLVPMIWGTPLFAFQNGQHQNISQQAINNAAIVAPDIQKFGPLINSWSWGIGGSANLTTEQTLKTLFTIKGNPVEELAHLENQQAQIDATASINGGDYLDMVQAKIPDAFTAGNFSNTTPQSEGAYVWMGAALHLIEDQASTPHGANIIHGVGDEFEGPLSQNGQKIKSFVFTSNTSANIAKELLYSQCQATTQSKIPNFKNFSYSPAARLWLLNSELSGFGIDGSNGFGRYGGVILSPPLSDAPSFTQSVPADLYSEPSGPSIFTDQSTQAGDFGTNFLIQMSKSLPPLVTELSIAGAGVSAGGAPAIINAQNGTPISFKISENRTQAVTVNVVVQETNQSIISDAASVTLSSFRSADGLSDSQNLPGPITWSNNQTPLFGTLATDMTLLPFDGTIQFNWKGNVAGTALTDGTYTLCVTATPSPSDASSNPSSPVCQRFMVDRTPPTATLTDANGLVAKVLPGKPQTGPGVTNGNALSLYVQDLAPDGVTPGSGLSAITVTGSNSGVVRNQTYSGQNAVTLPLPGLAADNYLIAIVDLAGNQSNVNITVTPPPPPTLSVSVNNNAFLYENFSGASDPADIPSTIFMSWPAIITGPDGSYANYGPFNLQLYAATGSPLTLNPSLTVNLCPTGVSPGDSSCLVSAANTGPGFNATSPGPINAGSYTFTVSDTNGATSTATFVSAVMNATLQSGDCTSANLTLNASQGLFEADQFDNNGGFQSFSFAGLPNNAPLSPALTNPITFQDGGIEAGAQINVLDYDGNTIGLDVEGSCGPQGNGAALFESPELPATLAPGNGQTVPIGMGAFANVDVLSAGTMSLFVGVPGNFLPVIPPGYKFVSGQAPFFLQIGNLGGGLSQIPTVAFPLSLSIPIDNSLTAQQLQFVEADFDYSETNMLLPGTLVAVTGDPLGAFTVTSAAAHRFSIFAPTALHPAIVATGGAKLLYDGTTDPGLTISAADPTAQPLAAIIASATAQGLVLAGPVLQIANPTSNLNFPAALTLPPAPPGAAIYQLLAGQPAAPVSNLFNRFYNHSLAVPLSSNVNAYYAAFTVAGPVTTLSIDSTAVSPGYYGITGTFFGRGKPSCGTDAPLTFLVPSGVIVLVRRSEGKFSVIFDLRVLQDSVIRLNSSTA